MHYDTSLKFYPLTDPQKRIWYTEKIYSNSSMWNIGGALRVKSSLYLDLMEEAVNILVKEYEVFNLGFTDKNGVAFQYIKDYEKISLNKYYFADFGQFKDWADNDFKSGFSMEKGNLFYFALCYINESESLVYLKMHHIISDGWSFAIIAKELCNIYNGLLSGTEIRDSIDSSYLDFISNEEKYINSSRFERDKEYWNEKFSILPENLYSEKVDGAEARRKVFELGEELSQKVQKFIKDNGCSLNTFFISVYLIYFHRMFDQEDIVLGNPNFNRTNRKERGIAGMFTSTLPFRYRVNREDTIQEFINKVNKELLACFKHQKYPYNRLIQDLKLGQSGYDSLFNVCINYYNTDFNIVVNDKKVEVVDFYSGYQAYPLQIVVKEWGQGGNIELDFDYNVNVHSEENIEIAYEYMRNIIENILYNPERKIEKIKLIKAEEIDLLQVKFNSTSCSYPDSKTIVKLFEEQVERNPHYTALRFNNSFMTYEELNYKCNQLARKLIEKGVGREAKVAVMATHSYEMVMAILSIIKAGAAYVPIDGNYPVERINYMIEDSGVSLILTNYEHNPEVAFKGEYIYLDDSELYTGENSNLDLGLSSRDLAYMIYTSGSTGKPKGVMIEHRGLVNYSWWAAKRYIKSSYESFALYSSLSFDLTVTSIFAPLINGNCIDIYHDDGSEFILYRILRENKVSIIKLTPAHLSLLKDMDNRNSCVKRFIVGGENLKVSLAASVHESFGGNIEIYNEYGPTETTVGCMIHKYNYFKDKGSSVPIGVPADNVQIYILDDVLNIVPYGKVGELYIGGEGVARGYLNHEELTKERFVKNSFIDGHRMYKTGDTAIYRKDGNIEYIGRKDKQVKIRGHRIELEEIENHLLNMENIIEAVVIDREDKKGDKKLHAYIVSSEEVAPREFKNYLSKLLPNYMIPSHFIYVDKIPLTPNGKVNTKLLPEPKELNTARTSIMEPRDECEKKLIHIMQEVLNIDEISIRDNFYELGGDSIKAIQIANRLNNEGISIKVKDILSSRIIGEIAATIRLDESVQAPQTQSEGIAGNTPIMSWFFEQQFKDYNHWNQTVLLKLDNRIKTPMLESVVQKLITYHDSLRLNFNKSTGMMHYNSEHLKSPMEVLEFDLSKINNEEQKLHLIEIGEKFKGSFDIEKDLLFKACIFDLGKDERRLLISAHHLVVDGVSWRIILEDLNSLLICELKGESCSIPPKTHSIQAWVTELEKYSQKLGIDEVRYWNEVLEEKITYPIYHEPIDSIENNQAGSQACNQVDNQKVVQEVFQKVVENDREANSIKHSAALKIELSQEDTEKILGEANKAYGTEASELQIIALALALAEFNGMEKVAMELEGHGREEISSQVDISRTVGWFTSMYPVVLHTEGSNLNEKLKSLKEQLRAVPKKGFDFGVLKYVRNVLKVSSPRYIRFNYLGDFDSTLNNALFERALEDSGAEFGKENHITSLMEIVSMVMEKKLNITMSFSKKMLKEETAEGFMEEFLKQLKEVADYCCRKDSIEFTPSDFEAAEISQEDLDSLFG